MHQLKKTKQNNKTIPNILLFWKEHPSINNITSKEIHCIHFLLDVFFMFTWCHFFLLRLFFLSQYFLSLLLIPSLPSLRSGLPASSSCFPAAAPREDRRTTASALWEEDRQTTGREQRQSHTETGLPTRLQHTQMYKVNHIVFSNYGKISTL